MIVKLIPPFEYALVQDKVRVLLEKAVEYSADEWDIDDAEQLILAGKDLLFGVFVDEKLTGVCTGCFAHYPKQTTFLIKALAGEFQTARKALNELEAFVKLGGASAVEACCRESMVRYARRHGFQPRHVLIRKVI